MGLTKSANDALDRMPPAHVDDLCNALAGMSHTERVEFVRAMVGRAPEPLKIEMSLKPIEAWWEQKIRTGIMLSARPEEGWLRGMRIAELRDDYIAFTKRTDITDKGNSTAMGRFLKKVLPKLTTSSITMYVDVHASDDDGATYKPNTVNQVKRRVRHYEFPAHDAAKRFWLEYMDHRG